MQTTTVHWSGSQGFSVFHTGKILTRNASERDTHSRREETDRLTADNDATEATTKRHRFSCGDNPQMGVVFLRSNPHSRGAILGAFFCVVNFFQQKTCDDENIPPGH